MNQLLAKILDAHDDRNRWNEYHKVEATIVSGGGFFPLKPDAGTHAAQRPAWTRTLLGRGKKSVKMRIP